MTRVTIPYKESLLVITQLEELENYEILIHSNADETIKNVVRLKIENGKGSKIIRSCVIVAEGGCVGFDNQRYLIDRNDDIIIACGDSVFCLSEDLDLKWKTKADEITCFSIFKHEKDYIIHGEVYISRLTANGKMLWQFGGADIFLNLNENPFEIKEGQIFLKDFSGNGYKINFNGESI